MEQDPPAGTEPRPAATVLALRRGSEGVEVLMVRRAREARFMGGAWVFPGGTLEPEDSSPEARRVISWSGPPDELPWRAAAVRELAEEVGIVLGGSGSGPVPADGRFFADLDCAGVVVDGDALTWIGHWVTPAGLPIRFDARFYAVEVEASTDAASDDAEVFTATWVRPEEALAAADRGDWRIELPTRAHLELLGASDGIAPVTTGGDPPPRIEPRLIRDEEGISVVLPGEPGYEGSGR